MRRCACARQRARRKRRRFQGKPGALSHDACVPFVSVGEWIADDNPMIMIAIRIELVLGSVQKKRNGTIGVPLRLERQQRDVSEAAAHQYPQ